MLACSTNRLQPKSETDFNKPIGVRCNESNIAWLWRWILDRGILLHSQFQSILMSDLSPSWPMSSMLGRDNMLSDLIMRQVSPDTSVVADDRDVMTISHDWQLATPPQRHDQNAPLNTLIKEPLVGRLKC